MNNLCVYHANCTDGFGAAWAVNKYFNQSGNEAACSFHPGIYNNDPPDVTGKDVYLVDFSYKRETILKMLETVNSLTIIDHHKSSLEDLGDLEHPKLRMVLDGTHSGAVLTWQYFFPYAEIPPLLLRIEDRDLWKFELTGTKEITASLYSYQFNFEIWDSLDICDLYTEGLSILRAHNKLVLSVLAAVPRRMLIGRCDVPVVNCGANLASDVGHELAKGEPFAATYVDTNKYRIYSLRSAPDGKDVSKIAEIYGGGGHKHAAGFRVPIAEAEGSALVWD